MPTAIERTKKEFFLNLHTGRSLTENTIPDAVLMQSDLMTMSTELLETRTAVFLNVCETAAR